MAFDPGGRTFWGFPILAPNGKPLQIKVYGEKIKGKYIKFKYSPEELSDLFPPKGMVFAPLDSISSKNHDSYHFFQVEPSKTKKSEKDHDYSIVYESCQLISSFHKLITIPELANLSCFPLEEIQKLLQNQDNHIKDGTYFIRISQPSELIGPFRKNQKDLFPQHGKEVFVFQLDDSFDEYVLEDNTLILQDKLPLIRKIDCMSNEQLQEWFRKKIKEASSIDVSKISLLDIDKIKNIPVFEADDLDKVRFERALECLTQYKFSYDELKNVFVNEGFEKINEKIVNMRKEIKDEFLKENQALEDKKNAISSEIENLNSSKEKIQSKISDAENLLKSINDNYDALLLQMKVSAKINPVNQPEERKVAKPHTYEVGRIGKAFKAIKEDGLKYFDLIERNLKRAGYDDKIIDLYRSENDEKDVLFNAKAVFIPCISWAYIYAQSIGNARVFTIQVEHDWLHYRDFCNNGLVEIWSEAAANIDTNYIIAFENLNLTQPECGMMPLLNIIKGHRPFLEGTQYDFLHNIKIFATVVPFSEKEDIGLKLSKNQFSTWGTFGSIEKQEYFIPIKLNSVEKPYGFFSPDDFKYLKQEPKDVYFGKQ